MIKLQEPSKKLARTVLGEVGFDESLVGIKMRSMAGNQQIFLYSFKEAAQFLRMDSVDELMIRGSKSHVGYIDLNVLKRWVLEVMGDTNLAAAIDTEINRENNYRDRANAIKALMSHRLSQCEAVLETNQ